MAPANPRIQARIPDRLAARLSDRAKRMLQVGGDDQQSVSENRQAITEIGMWYDALDIELRRLRLTRRQAMCIAAVCNTFMLDATLARPGLIYAECSDAFYLAREGAPNPDISSYGRQFGPEGCDAEKWEQDLLAYLGKIGPVGDHALRDAISRWWDNVQDESVQGFAKVGLQVQDDDPEDRN